MLGDFERGIWFKYKACSLISSGGVLLYIEDWVRLCNAVIGAKNRSKKVLANSGRKVDNITGGEITANKVRYTEYLSVSR
jgi:hypothetical protein